MFRRNLALKDRNGHRLRCLGLSGPRIALPGQVRKLDEGPNEVNDGPYERTSAPHADAATLRQETVIAIYEIWIARWTGDDRKKLTDQGSTPVSGMDLL